jgi:hypothetical protein
MIYRAFVACSRLNFSFSFPLPLPNNTVLQASRKTVAYPAPETQRDKVNAATVVVDCIWNVMAHAQKPDFVFRRNGRVNLNRRGRQFSRLLAAEVCTSAVVMVDKPCSEVVWRILATHSIRQFPLHFPSLRHSVPSHFNWTLTLRKSSGTAVQLNVSCSC